MDKIPDNNPVSLRKTICSNISLVRSCNFPSSCTSKSFSQLRSILEAKINDQNKFNFVINHVSFFLDEYPTKLSYEKNVDTNSYDFGDLKLMVSKPLPSDLQYIQEKHDDSYKIIEVKKWDLNNNNIDLEFQLPDYIFIIFQDFKI